jgi:predicted aminopeptidase
MAFFSSSGFKIILSVLILTVVAVVFSLSGSLGYILHQAGPFLRHHLRAESVERVLQHDDTGPETRAFLQRVQDIHSFAVSVLGLSDTRNYSTYYEAERDFLVAVVQAAPQFSVEPHMFSYPLFGDLPYKGFYDVEAAKAEAKQLEKQGLDVYVRKVDAFSSLGFFSDPLFSFMKDYHPDRLAELIIHEQTHATIFIKGHAKFNEQLATFVGRKGAAEYIARRYGRDSSEYARMMDRRHDAKLFRRDIAALAAELQALYSSCADRKTMRKKKRQLIDRFQRQFSEGYENRYATDVYAGLSDMELNNAYISLFRIYETQNSFFEDLYAWAGDIKSMLAYLQEAPGLKKAPWSVRVPGG